MKIYWNPARILKKAVEKDRPLKVVLYGRPSAGKTTYLASLAMDRLSHPEGYTCTWINDTETIPEVDAGTDMDRRKNDPAVQLSEGRKWLTHAISLLVKGDVPPANDVHAPYRYLFSVTRTNPPRQQRLEMIDYSGELVDPRQAATELSQLLLKHLEEADGILVLAEASKPEEAGVAVVPAEGAEPEGGKAKGRDLHDELRVLREALALVARRRKNRSARPSPFGLVLNKWDRVTRLDPAKYDPAQTTREAEDYVNKSNPPVPQKSLFDVLQGVAGAIETADPHGAVSIESVAKIFALSALGKTKKVELKNADGKTVLAEMPATIRPLQAYGMEDPLVWIWDKTDAIDIAEIRQGVAGLGAWKFWEGLSGRGAALERAARQTAGRLPPTDARVKELRALAETASRAYWNQRAFAAAITIAVLCFGAQVITCLKDRGEYAVHSRAISSAEHLPVDPETFQTAGKQAVEFLASYAKPSFFRWLSRRTLNLTEAQATEKRSVLEKALAETSAFMSTVNGITESARQNGGDARAFETNISALTALATDESIVKKATILADAKTSVTTLYNNAVSTIAESELQIAFDTHVSSGDIVAAARLVSANKDKFPQKCEALQRILAEKWQAVFTHKMRDMIGLNLFSEGVTLLNKTKDDPNLAKLLGQSFATGMRPIEDDFQAARAAHAYATWYAKREASDSARFATDVMSYGTPAQQAAVASFTKWQASSREKRAWDVTVSEFEVRDHGAIFSTDYRLTTYHSLTKLGEITFSVDAKPADVSLPSGSQRVTATYDELLELRFHCETTNWFTGQISFDGSYSGRLADLRDSVKVPLEGSSGYANPVLTVSIRLPDGSRIPTPPLLPPP